ncbi:MAG: hypothetical protein U0P30_03240 [Vicinamibacterales bacterium]
MADAPAPPPVDDERPLGLAPYLDEDVEFRALIGRVHRSIARREVSGQAVELTMHGLTGVLVEYLKAIFEAFGGRGRGGRRAD